MQPQARCAESTVGFATGGFVSGIRNQTIRTVLSATAAMLINPISVAKMLDDETEERGAERRADARERADKALGQIEAPGAFGEIGDDQGGEHAQRAAAHAVEQLNAVRARADR